MGRVCGVRHPRGTVCPVPIDRRDDSVFIKRIVAGPGDRVQMRNGLTVRNGEQADEFFARSCGDGGCEFPKPVTIPADHYFALGDNRRPSDDSRYWGPVPESWIVGRIE